MSGDQGFRVTRMLIVGFFLTAIIAVIAVALGKIDVETTTGLFLALGALARLCGLDDIYKMWLGSRGKTSGIDTQKIE